MRQLFSMIAILSTTTAFSQVGIGTVAPNEEALLDFGVARRGMVLSPVSNVAAMTATPGTIAFDGATGSFRTYNGAWSTVIAGGVTGTGNTVTDANTQGVIIGASTSTAQGALILEEDGNKKTLILPKVAQVEFNIKTPTAGMIVYDTVSDLVKVYNGTRWTNF
jgi:hypothetical protein